MRTILWLLLNTHTHIYTSYVHALLYTCTSIVTRATSLNLSIFERFPRIISENLSNIWPCVRTCTYGRVFTYSFISTHTHTHAHTHLFLPDRLQSLLVSSVQCLFTISCPLDLTGCNDHLKNTTNISIDSYSVEYVYIIYNSMYMYM